MMWRSALRRWLPILVILWYCTLQIHQITMIPGLFHNLEIPRIENIRSDNPPYRHDAVVYPISNVCKLFHKTKSKSKNYCS